MIKLSRLATDCSVHFMRTVVCIFLISYRNNIRLLYVIRKVCELNVSAIMF